MKYGKNLTLLILCVVSQKINAMGTATQAARQAAGRATSAAGRATPVAARSLSSATARAPQTVVPQAGRAYSSASASEAANQASRQPSGLIRGAAAGLAAGTAIGAGAMGYSRNVAEHGVRTEEIYMPAYNKGLLVQQNLEKVIQNPKTATNDAKIQLIMSYIYGQTYEPKPLPCQVNYERARQILDTLPRNASWMDITGDKIKAADIVRVVEGAIHESEAAVQARVKRNFIEQEGDLLRQERLTRFTQEKPKA